ncbi:unnamed protein product [Prorocentrum cordatum]|uniref:Selenoprotein O n=1 Tax=Prorocentrum cordatum TaxID=2364126 RepID=A0ABN9XP73_9DINO|nr:unnamed protein product [Polarella glacialis]
MAALPPPAPTGAGVRRARRAPSRRPTPRACRAIACTALAQLLLGPDGLRPFAALGPRALGSRRPLVAASAVAGGGPGGSGAGADAELEALEEAAKAAQAAVELAEARAAAARAGAELAAARAKVQAGAGAEGTQAIDAGASQVPFKAVGADEPQAVDVEGPEVVRVVAPWQTTPLLDGMLATSFTQDEARPAAFLTSPSGTAFFNLIGRFEDTRLGDSADATVLGITLEACALGLWDLSQFGNLGKVSELGKLPGVAELSAEERRDAAEIGSIMEPDMVASLLSARFSKASGTLRGSDWRPFVRKLCEVEGLPERVDRIINWQALFPPGLENKTGLPSSLAKAWASENPAGKPEEEGGASARVVTSILWEAHIGPWVPSGPPSDLQPASGNAAYHNGCADRWYHNVNSASDCRRRAGKRHSPQDRV